jgi:hypothetical protein
MGLPGGVGGARTRGFITEIAVIVIGVLIALGAGQLVEAWNWQRKAAEGEQQLLQEARYNIQYAAEQVAVQPCIDAQLRALRDRVLASGSTLQPAPAYADVMGTFVYRTPSRPYEDAIWQALNNDGTIVHMRDSRRQLLSVIYSATDILQELRATTDLLSGRLMSLSHPLPLDPGTRATLVAGLEEQRARSSLQSLVAGQLLGAYRHYGVPFPDSAEVLLVDSGTVAFCREHDLPLRDWMSVVRAQPSAFQ